MHYTHLKAYIEAERAYEAAKEEFQRCEKSLKELAMNYSLPVSWYYDGKLVRIENRYYPSFSGASLSQVVISVESVQLPSGID